jgi:ribosomal protein L37AE/L43A
VIDLGALRPGGGESFSGGGHYGGSNGGDGDIGAIFELVFYLLRLCVEVPAVGGVVLVLAIIFIVYWARFRQKHVDWDSGPAVEPERAVSLDSVKRLDPDFSPVVFEDFAFRLFSTAQRVRASATELATVAPYVGDDARSALAAREPKGIEVEQVVVGALRPYRADVPADSNGRVRIGVEFEANVMTAKATYYSVESWLFVRDAARRSKPPGDRTFPCPNCGAPWQSKSTGSQVCASCGQTVDNGRFDWLVETISVSSLDERGPTLTAEVAERGTDLPTRRQDRVDERWLGFANTDPELTWPSVQARLAMIYDQLNTAWSSNELEPVRGLVSDGLYDYLQYWVTNYKRQGLANRMVDAKITHTTMAKLARDRWYDALTIRVWGKAKDFIVRVADDHVVRGSRHRERAYSEYWTLIRSAARRGAAKAEPACGNCGAPLKVNQAGSCEHCGAHVTAGAFDWVLSKIEQDDTYRG